MGRGILVMKTILFDVDGVFLSESRCFDASALTVYEVLTSEAYFNLPSSYALDQLTDDDIVHIRHNIFQNDAILHRLKSLGMNANWDMLFIVTALHVIELLKCVPAHKRESVVDQTRFNAQTFKQLQNDVTGFDIDYTVPLRFLDTVPEGKSAVYKALEDYAQQQLDIEDTALFSLKHAFWHLTQSMYQEWYLGHDLYTRVEQRPARTTFKQGYVYDEVVLRPVEELQTLLHDLKQAGYQLGIATGRPYTETVVPLEAIGLLQYFDTQHVGTASDVLAAEATYPEHKPLNKPNPFSYLVAFYGQHDDMHYIDYIQNQQQRLAQADVVIVGDSLADLLCAKALGAQFIAPLTGLKGQHARSEMEQYEADIIVNHVSELRDILL